MDASIQVIVLLTGNQSVQLQVSKSSHLILRAATAEALRFDLSDPQCQCGKIIINN